MGKRKLQRQYQRAQAKKTGPGLQQLLMQAWEAYHEEQYALAEQLVKTILQKKAGQEDALLLQSLLVEAQKESPAKLALEAHQKGDVRAAETYYKQALDEDPDDAQSLHGYGVLQRALGHLDKAYDYITNAIEQNGNVQHYHYNLGNVLLDMGRFAQAIKVYEKSLSLGNPFPELLTSLCAATRALGDTKSAIQYGKRALQLNPNFFRAHNNLCVAFVEEGDIEQGVCHGEAATRLAPDFIEAYANLGAAYRERGDLHSAKEILTKAIALAPKSAEAHNNMSIICRELGEYEKAFEHCEIAESLQPDYIEAQNNMGALLYNQGLYDEALAQFKRVLQHHPDCADALYNQSKVYLIRGDYHNGWKGYESRFEKGSPVRLSVQPTQCWQGENIEDKRLFVLAEQGLGDEIVHASLFNEVRCRSKRCFIECDKRLLGLFSRSFPDCQFVPRNISQEEFDSLATDVQIPAGSLPAILRRSAESFSQQQAYLQADPLSRGVMREVLSGFGDGLKVGIAWRTKNQGYHHEVSVDLAKLQPLLQIPGVVFVNLQYGDCEAELADKSTMRRIPDLDTTQDIEGLAGLIAECDLVVTVDNSVSVLAGALGVPTWILTSHVPHHMWLLELTKSVWYPSVTLFRQPSQGDWSSVISDVGVALKEKVHEHCEPSNSAIPSH